MKPTLTVGVQSSLHGPLTQMPISPPPQTLLQTHPETVFILRALWVSQGFTEKQKDAGPWPGIEIKSPQLSGISDLPWQIGVYILHAYVQGIL